MLRVRFSSAVLSFPIPSILSRQENDSSHLRPCGILLRHFSVFFPGKKQWLLMQPLPTIDNCIVYTALKAIAFVDISPTLLSFGSLLLNSPGFHFNFFVNLFRLLYVFSVYLPFILAALAPSARELPMHQTCRSPTLNNNADASSANPVAMDSDPLVLFSVLLSLSAEGGHIGILF